MKSFFEGIQFLFEELLFIPYNYFRNLELVCWSGANIINWIFMAICATAIVYWVKQLQGHKKDGQDDQDTTAHSFLS
ncbi:MAG: uracil phosphoribosyltransferase [Flavobacteriales bacterium]|nr:uracil phosphoribosyltransferase [Flavobacteriales bacterium]